MGRAGGREKAGAARSTFRELRRVEGSVRVPVAEAGGGFMR